MSKTHTSPRLRQGASSNSTASSSLVSSLSEPLLSGTRAPSSHHDVAQQSPGDDKAGIHGGIHGGGGQRLSSATKTLGNLIVSIVGAGVLGLPYAFKQSGWLFSLVCLAAMAFVSYYGMLLLVAARQFVEDDANAAATAAAAAAGASSDSVEASGDDVSRRDVECGHVISVNGNARHKSSVGRSGSTIGGSENGGDEGEIESGTEENGEGSSAGVGDVGGITKAAGGAGEAGSGGGRGSGVGGSGAGGVHAVKVNSYGDLGFRLFGVGGRVAVDAMMLVSQGGFCVAYLIFIGQNVSSVLTHSPKHKTLVIAAVAPLEILLSWMRSLTRLAPFSIFADIANISAFALVIFYGVRSFHGFAHLSAFTGVANAPMALGVAVYAFEGVGMTLPLEASMKQPARFPSVLGLGLTIIAVTYAAVGTAGYLGFGEETQEIVTLNLPPGWPSEAVKLGICAALFFTFPVMMYPVHEIYERRLYLSPWVQRHVLTNGFLRRMLFRSLRSLAVLAVAVVAVGVPHFSTFISLIGCSVCSALAFVFPSMFHLKACKGRASWAVVVGNWCLVVFGVLFGCWGTIDAVKRFQQGPG